MHTKVKRTIYRFNLEQKMLLVFQACLGSGLQFMNKLQLIKSVNGSQSFSTSGMYMIVILLLSIGTKAQSQDLPSALIGEVNSGMRQPAEDSTAMYIDYIVTLTDALSDVSQIIITVSDSEENEVYQETIGLVRDNQYHIISIVGTLQRYVIRQNRLTIPVFFEVPIESAFDSFTLQISTVSQSGVAQTHFLDQDSNF